MIETLEDGQCTICGGYNCSVCADCGQDSHVIGGWPFCPHGLSPMKSGFAELTDTIQFPTDMTFRSAREIDQAAKKHNLVVSKVNDGKRWA